MARSFLVRFRTKDARSLARALILLFVCNAFVSAFHLGSMAGLASDGANLCTSNNVSFGDAGAPGFPSGQEHYFCCVLGCSPMQADLFDIKIGPLEDGRTAEIDGQPHPSSIAVLLRRVDNAGPRGPPVLV